MARTLQPQRDMEILQTSFYEEVTEWGQTSSSQQEEEIAFFFYQNEQNESSVANVEACDQCDLAVIVDKASDFDSDSDSDCDNSFVMSNISATNQVCRQSKFNASSPIMTSQVNVLPLYEMYQDEAMSRVPQPQYEIETLEKISSLFQEVTEWICSASQQEEEVASFVYQNEHIEPKTDATYGRVDLSIVVDDHFDTDSKNSDDDDLTKINQVYLHET